MDERSEFIHIYYSNHDFHIKDIYILAQLSETESIHRIEYLGLIFANF